jgi:hypothetical protein
MEKNIPLNSFPHFNFHLYSHTYSKTCELCNFQVTILSHIQCPPVSEANGCVERDGNIFRNIEILYPTFIQQLCTHTLLRQTDHI